MNTRPVNPETALEKITALLSRKLYISAARELERILGLKPNDPAALIALAECCVAAGEIDQAIDHLTRAVSDPTTNPELCARATLEIAKIIPGSAKQTTATIRQAREAWATQAERLLPIAKTKKRAKPPAAPKPKSKIRIAYTSANFSSRPAMKSVFGVINEHNRDAVEIHILADGKPPTAASGYRRHAADHLHDITKLDNAAAAALIEKLGIDILIDLNGYNHPPRLGLLLRKPAPIQLGWANTNSTTGLRQFDALIADANVVYNEEAPAYSEKILRVSGTYLAFNVQYDTPDVAPPPCLVAPRKSLTFGCLAPQSQITPEVFAAWAQILAGAPPTRLVLQNSYLADEENRASVLTRFSKFGVAPERITLHPPAAHLAHLATYVEIDVALDTFPASSAVTTMEALWQGVPIVTYDGDRWASRITKSLLLAARLDDWVVRSREAYVKRAIDLARSERTPAMLAAQRREMRWGLMESAACDTSRLAAELEAIYKKFARPTAAAHSR